MRRSGTDGVQAQALRLAATCLHTDHHASIPFPPIRPFRSPCRALGAWAAEMLVGKEDFVKVRGNGHFIVFEVAEPAAAALNSLGQKGQYVPHWQRDAPPSRGRFAYPGCSIRFIRSVVDA